MLKWSIILKSNCVASHNRTQTGAKTDLDIETPNGDTLAIKIRRILCPNLTAAFKESIKTINVTRVYYLTKTELSKIMNHPITGL